MQIKPRHFLRVLYSKDGYQEADESKVRTKTTIALTLGNFVLIVGSSQKTWECVKKLINQAVFYRFFRSPRNLCKWLIVHCEVTGVGL